MQTTPKTLLRRSATIFMIAAFTIGFYSCDNNNDSTSPTTGKNISLATSSTFGQYMVGGNGMTLYVFAKDVSGESMCPDGTCLPNWPIFYEQNIDPGTGLNASDFATITRSDGMKQTTFLGWPLYYYAGDAAEGDIKGDGVGGIWFVAKPDYSLMMGNAQLIGHDGKHYMSDYTEGDGLTKYLTDINGRTLYIFKNDTKDTNNFTQSDFSNNSIWPIFYVEIDKLPSGFNTSDFGEIDVFGQPQLTFKGWPLYYFGQDAQRGENKGVSFPSPGVWPIANNDTPAAQ